MPRMKRSPGCSGTTSPDYTPPITIEIVEGSVDPEVLARAIDAIHDRGGRAAMDDFGSTLWTLDAPLKSLPGT